METLYYAYLDGYLKDYLIYYMDPDNWTTHMMRVDYVIVNGIQQKIKLISENDSTVILSASGSVLDISDTDPVHFVTNLAPNAKHVVCAWDKNGRPGNKQLVRKIKGYETTGTCTVMTVPTPNIISDKLFVLMT